jgi:hypothetical protein
LELVVATNSYSLKRCVLVTLLLRPTLMTRNLLFKIALSALALAGVQQLQAQASANAQNEEPLQMVIDYGGGKQTHRESHHGVVEPVGVPIGQQVAITLRFLRKRAGDQVMIGLLDGGQINVQGPVTISSDGTVAFSFQPGGSSGLHRLVINGAQSYQLMLYAFDPNRRSSANSSRP